MTNNVNDVRCIVCLTEYDSREAVRINSHPCCPNCKSGFIPMKIQHDGFIKVNWQELIMVMTYAVRYTKTFDTSHIMARDARRAIKQIYERLEKSKPIGEHPLVEPKDEIRAEFTDRIDLIEFSPEDMKFNKDDEGRIISPFYQPKNK